MAFGDFFLRDAAGSPERARWLHLARSGSQSQLAIWFILPACGASHIIKHHLAYLCSQSQPKVQFILLAWGTCLTIIHINAWDSKHGIINHFKATCHPVIQPESHLSTSWIVLNQNTDYFLMNRRADGWGELNKVQTATYMYLLSCWCTVYLQHESFIWGLTRGYLTWGLL